MSVLGNNLLAQYYAQNQYVGTPSLWIEADSWGESVWLNKGNGGYNLYVQDNKKGSVVGKAITATRQDTFAVTVDINAVGSASFTVEFVATLDPSHFEGSGTLYSFLFSQRNASSAQHGSVQGVFFVSSGVLTYTMGGWNSNGENIADKFASTMNPVANSVQYFAFTYNATTKTATMKMDNSIVTSQPFDFECTVDFTKIGAAGFNSSISANNYPFIGSLYSLRVHKRSLTALEQAHNMAIDKARFNF
jgi:hypothetical protein